MAFAALEDNILPPMTTRRPLDIQTRLLNPEPPATPLAIPNLTVSTLSATAYTLAPTIPISTSAAAPTLPSVPTPEASTPPLTTPKNRFDAVMGKSLATNPLSLDGGRRITVESSEDSDSDMNTEDATPSEMNGSEREHNTETSSESATKRPKHAKHIDYGESRMATLNVNNPSCVSAAALSRAVDNVSKTEQDERWADIRRREQVLEQRELGWLQNMLQKQDMVSKMNEREFDAAMQRRREEMDREKAESSTRRS
ncbi:unnamed protein product [Mortierella alpina]